MDWVSPAACGPQAGPAAPDRALPRLHLLQRQPVPLLLSPLCGVVNALQLLPLSFPFSISQEAACCGWGPVPCFPLVKLLDSPLYSLAKSFQLSESVLHSRDVVFHQDDLYDSSSP